MKILSTLLLLISFKIGAQPWCAAGAQWHYRLYQNLSLNYADGYIQLNNTGTITVGGKVCDNLVGTRCGVFFYPSAPSTTVTNFLNLNTYSDNNVVYLYNTETLVFDTVVNFNSSVVDKWRLINYPASMNTNTCNFPRPICTVINTGTTSINNQTLKSVSVSYQLFSFTNTVTIIEKIGCTTGFLFPYFHCINDGPYYGSFRCYSDNTFALYNPLGMACNYTTVGLDKLSKIDFEFSISPNPANNKFSINLPTNSTSNIEITNSIGQLFFLKLNQENKFEIDCSIWPSGIYFVRINNSEFKKVVKFVKE